MVQTPGRRKLPLPLLIHIGTTTAFAVVIAVVVGLLKSRSISRELQNTKSFSLFNPNPATSRPCLLQTYSPVRFSRWSNALVIRRACARIIERRMHTFFERFIKGNVVVLGDCASKVIRFRFPRVK